MPRYDFRCDECGEEREVSMSIQEMKESEVICPACSSTMKKVYNAAGISWNCTGSTGAGSKRA